MKDSTNSRLSIWASFALLAAATGMGRAQESMQYASASGRVTDQTGAVIRGAVVKARQIETNLLRETDTDEDGRFRFSHLRLGPWEVLVQQQGFSDAKRTLTLTVGSAFDLPIKMSIAGAESSLVVTGEGAVLEAARTQIAGTITQAETRTLPLNGRNFLDLALLVPGVSPTNTASNQLFAETSAVPGQGLSVSSQRNFSNSFIVDGLSANDDAAGLSGIFYGLDVVQEFQVVTSGGQAEFGRALGGYMNIVTKSGTNTLHGDLYSYIRNQRLNAANALSHTSLPLTQVQSGASVGGRLIPDRTFYFANVEHRSLNQSGLITIAPANIAAINSRLESAGYQGPLLATGLYPNPVHNVNVLGKVDHQLNSRDLFTARYSLYDVNSKNSRGAGGLNAASSSANLDNTDHTLALGNVASLSPRFINETRAQITRSDLATPPSDRLGPTVSISGVATFGTLSGSPTGRTNDLYEIVNNASYQAGAHALRAGIDVLINRTTVTYPRSFRGNYAFSTLANFLSGTYNNNGFTQTFNNSVVGQNNPNVGFFLQDEWKASPRLTFNIGVRYDLQFLKSIRTDRNNVSPRAGFAWTPFASRRTVLRGSYGLFYDRVPLRALANALLSAGNTTDPANLSQISLSLSPTQTGAPTFPNILNSLTLPAGVLFNFTTMRRYMQNAYSVQGSFEIEHQLGDRSTVSIGYQHVRGLHLIMTVNQNVPSCIASGNNNGCRPNSSYANNSQYSPLADSRYDGLHLSFVQRPTKWGSYRMSYTYSKALDNVGEFFFSSPIDNFNIWQDYGRSDDDQRHRFVLNGNIQSSTRKPRTVREWLSHDFQLSTMLQYYSALPLNITAGSATIQGTQARPTVNGAFIGRNAGTSFDFLNLNVRATRMFHLNERVRLQAMAEAFNLLNQTNGVTMNGTFGAGTYPANPSATFRQLTAVGEPRTMQLALRVTF